MGPLTQPQLAASIASYNAGGNAATEAQAANLAGAFNPTTDVQRAAITKVANMTPSPIPVTSLSTMGGAQVLDKTAGQAARLTGTPPVTPPPATPATTPKTTVTLINPTTEQTVTFNNDALNQGSVQKYLDAGYTLSEASGAVPSWLTPGASSNPQLTEAKASLASAESELNTAKARLLNFNVGNDPQLQSLLGTIASGWDQRLADLKTAGDSRIAALAATGIRLGSQWTGGMGGPMGGIVSAEEINLIKNLAALANQKAQALASAQQAYEKQQWTRYKDLVDVAQTTYDKMLTGVQALQKAQAAQDVKIQQSQQKVTLGTNIAKLMGEGITKPADILSKLQQTGDTTTNLDDIAKTLKDLNPKGGVGDLFSFSQSQVGKLLASGLSTDEIQAVHDFYNGRGEMPAVTPGQQSAIHDVLNGTTSKKGTTSKMYTSAGLSFTSGDIVKGTSLLTDSAKHGPGADGTYANPDLYLQMANAWRAQGGYIKDFLKNYPLSTYINPANTEVGSAINALIKQDAAALKTTGATGRGI